MLGLFGLIKRNLDFQGKLPNKWKDLPEWANRCYNIADDTEFHGLKVDPGDLSISSGICLFEKFKKVPVQFDTIASQWKITVKTTVYSPSNASRHYSLSAISMGSQEFDNNEYAYGVFGCATNRVGAYSCYPLKSSSTSNYWTQKSISHKGDIYLRIVHEAGQLSWRNEYSFDGITWNLVCTTTCAKGYSPKIFVVRANPEDAIILTKDIKFELDGKIVFGS